MDERHWWIATKIQETFQVDETDSPTALEQFLLEASNFELLSDFLSANGLNKLFVFGKRPDARSWIVEDLFITSTLINVKGIGLNDLVCVFFLRPSSDREVDQSQMHKQVFCGEIKNNPLHHLSTVLSQVFLPMVKSQEDWGKCPEEHKLQFVHSVEKYVHVLSNATSKSGANSQQILRLPDQFVSRDFSQHRISSQFDPSVIQSYEEILHEWIQAIEGVLSESADDRLLDIHSGPLTELERWKRRQRVLAGIMEQLKSKDCKNVIGVLIQVKSRSLRAWRAIDSSITDAQNETKDKVKYLEALRRHLEQLHAETKPIAIVNVVLPTLIGAIKQMDAISRFYARTGYLGLLCMKMGNQLASVCRDYIGETLTGSDLWKLVQDEIETEELPAPAFKISKKGSKKKELIHDDDKTLTGRLRACLALQSFFRDLVRNLRDSLGTAPTAPHSLNHSVSSLDAPTTNRSKIGKRTKFAATGSVVSGSDGKDYGSFSYGIPLFDDETILANLDLICGKLRQLLETISSLRQFNKLAKESAGLPRPRVEDIPSGQNSDESIQDELSSIQRPISPKEFETSKTQIYAYQNRTQQGMVTVPEEDEDIDDDFSSAPRRKSSYRLPDSESDLDDALDMSDSSPSPVQSQFNAAAFLKQLYSTSEDGPSIAGLISENVASMVKAMSSKVSASMLLDLQRKHKEKLDDSFSSFASLSDNLDQLLSVYLQSVFSKGMKTQQGLAILSKFNAVSQRPNLKEVISEHYSNVYATYAKELEDMQEMYEKNKHDPIIPRDAPPAAGAIYWSRQLLSHIEEPMKIFHENKSMNQNKEYHRTVKFYNKLATALVTFETLWYQQWCKSVEHVLAGLRAPILTHTDGELQVNADQQIPRQIQEAKWMLRMKLEIPDAAKLLLSKEKQFKHYKIHLEQCLHDYKKVCSEIPAPFFPLFKPHIDSVAKCLQVGLNTINWDSMNIDAFLHKARSTTQRLHGIVLKVNDVVKNKVERAISDIHEMLLFDDSFVLGKTWNTSELVFEMNKCISERGLQLQENVSRIEGAIQDIVAILTSSRINSAEHNHTGNTNAVKNPNLKKSRKPARGGSGSTSTGESAASSKALFEPEDSVLEKILDHYSRRTYQSVLNTVCQTLGALTTAMGAKIGDVNADYSYSRPGSSLSSSDIMRTDSSLSFISTASWWEETSVDTCEEGSLKFYVKIKFRIPDIVLDPPLSEVQQSIDEIVEAITTSTRGIVWWSGPNKNENFESSILMDEVVSGHRGALATVTKGLKNHIRQYIHRLSQYNFLWKDDMQKSYSKFMASDPDMASIRKEVEHLLEVEKKISSIPPELPAGSVILLPAPTRDALQGLAAAWKTQYAMVLHEDAKKKLDSVYQYRTNVQNRLAAPVTTLDQLNGTLSLLEEIHDMENKIDAVYLPIENMYDKLRSYDLRLARAELKQVESLRKNWADLVIMADELGQTLVKERRTSFEQELDKQLKTFVVEVIQFRNAFDAQGPAVPGVRPAEAVQRLHDFQNRYTLYEAKRKTLDSVQRLFGIPPKPFLELEKTGEELKLLGMLYGLFQKFIAFDRKFRDTLWEAVDLHAANSEVKEYWEECLNLPAKLKEWDAYTEMKNSISFYLDVLPLLHRLAKKGKFKDITIPEIRNRHWLQVMSVTNSKFQLEANLFKLGHLLDIGLLKHKDEIRDIAISASKELELEVKMRGVEEEWTEQVLTFGNYKRRGPVLLVKEDSERLLEQLEDAQALLANMLTSKHIGPLREEAASWAEKLKGVGEVLDLWLETQDLWLELEAVFSDHVNAKELPQEAKRFSMVDKSYVKFVRRAYDTKNILQCCYGGEVPKGVVLRHMQEELEICFKCLTQYLDKKRSVCPRFYFLTDASLLALLSRPNDLDSIRPHLRSIFSSIADIKIEKSSAWSDTVSSMKSTQNTPTPVPTDRRFGLGEDIHQRSPGVRFRSGVKSSDSPHFSASIADEVNDVYHASAVMATDKEYLQLDDEVSLYEGVELWLQNLQESVRRSLHSSISRAIEDVDSALPIEELAMRYPGQVIRLALLHYWTKECEAAISELKWDRKAVQNASKKFANVIARFPSALNRSIWKSAEEAMLPIHKLRLENMIMYSVHLRDSMEGLALRKIKEPGDFEWKRCIRFYSTPVDGMFEHFLYMFESRLKYGLEFYGVTSNFVMTPSTEKVFVSMSIAMCEMKGSAVVGDTCSGKTETVRGLAALLGKYLNLTSCSDSTELSSLSRKLQGLCSDGSWGCFDDVHLLSDDRMSIIMEFTTALHYALKVKTQAFLTCLGDDGQQLSVHQETNLFLTFNPSTFPSKKLSTATRCFYRTIHLIKLDTSAILKAHCTALGLRSPKALADRLRTLMELAQQQLPSERHQQTNLPALLIALNLAAQRRKSKEERVESRTADDLRMSRSNSQTSVRQLNQQMSISPTVVRTVPGDKIVTKKTSSSPNTLTSQAKIDHGFVAQALLETISPGLVSSDYLIFNNIVRDVFSGIQFVRDILTSMSGASPNGSTQLQSSAAKNHDMETAITQVAQEKGLVAHGSWVSKVLQLHQMAQLRQGVVVAGSAGTGKSSLISVLVDALCILPHNQQHSGRATSPAMSSHKLQRLNPMTVDDLSLMFGSMNHSNEWVDGILTHAWRKANRNQSTTWLCLDGPMVTCWADRLNSVLDGHKVLPLSNGERLQLTSNMRLIFETSELKNASPSLLSRTGLVYMDKNALGWRPLAKAWLDTRTKEEVNVLQKCFNKTLDPVCAFVFQESRLKIPVTEVGLFSTCLTLLGEMLNEHQQHIGGDLHVERLFLFCLVWSFGGLLEGNSLKAFSDLMKTLTSALPDYDHEISVFDYYVDESGEWDGWAARVPEATYTGTTDILGEVFVDTVDTIRVRSLLEFAHMARKHTLVIGERGIGKTSLVNDFLDTQDRQSSVLRRLVFSRASTASQLHSFVQHNIQHRQGFVYGAKDGKHLETFIDDINLPARDEHGVQRCNEVLRMLVDDHSLCKLTKPFEWRTVEGLEVLATMTAGSSDFSLDPRLLRHFAVLRLRPQSSADLRNIIFSVLEANLTDKPLNQELHECIAAASSKLIEMVKDVLRPCPMPGRHHYAFTLRQLIKMCQCLRRLTDEERANEHYVVSLWSHEMERMIGDQLCRSSDVRWFETSLKQITGEVFSHYFEHNKELLKYFVTFPVETKLHHRPIATSQRSISVKLHSINDPRDTLDCLKAHLTHYNEDQHSSHNALDSVIFSEDVLCHLIRMHRILSYHHGGSMVVVGAVGSHLTQLTRLALHVADLRPSPIDSSRPTAFFDSLRTAVRVAGIDGRPVSVMLSAREIHDPLFLDAINSLLVAGEYPHLFSNDELEGLLQVLTPTLRRHYPNMMSDPMKFFVSRVKSNLHIVLILPPEHDLLKIALSSYPGIVSECQVIWIRDWPQEVLIQQAEYFINHLRVAENTSLKAREALAMAIANMHSITLRDCKQTSWAGETNPSISVTGTSLQTKKDKETIKVEKMEMPNLPYSKSILLDRIKLMNKNQSLHSPLDIFVGPYTYRKFMECLHMLYERHSKVLEEDTLKLRRALDTLEETRSDAKTMQKAIRVIKAQYASAQVQVSDLFKHLTTEATKLEKLKAHFGTGGGSLHAFLQLTKDEESDYEEDTLLKYDENDEYDQQFEQMKEANLKSKRVQIDEEIEAAKHELEEARSSLVTAKNQVELWKNKVDRGCIERLKAFQNPPVLVAQVLEMVMVLVDAHPWLTGTRTEQQSQGRPETKTPRAAKRAGEAVDGSDKSSRVSSGSTLKSRAKKTHKQSKLARQMTRSVSSFGVAGDGSVDRNKWKSMQNFMNDTVRFVEMIHSVDWENGLNETILQDVESYLDKGKEGQEGVTGEGSLLQESQTVIHQRKSNGPGITISAARYSSEDAAVLVEYVISIVEYTRLCGPLKHAIDHLQQLETERVKIQQAEAEDQKPVARVDDSEDEAAVDDGNKLWETTSIEGLTKDDIQLLQANVNALQQRYDEAVIKKHRLKDELQTSQERLKSALSTLDSLKPLERSWKAELADTISAEQLVTNCVLAAAYLTYCGGMTTDARKRMTSFYTHVCKHYELPIPNKMLFNNYRLHEFLYSPLDVQHLCSKKLPVDYFTLDQACLLTAEHATWCLVCDPVAKVVNWLERYVEENLVAVHYNDLRAQFETCLSEGKTLLITYCDVKALADDARFREVLRHRREFHNSSAPFKMMVEDHEVECNPAFRLYLHTSTLPQDVPPEIAAYTTLVYLQSTREGVEIELLDRFIRLEKPRLKEDWMNTQRDKMKNMKVLISLEDQLKNILAGEFRLLNDLAITKKLAEIKKQYDEATETQTKIDATENAVDRAKEGFREVALRGAVLFDVIRSLPVVNPIYQFSWQQFLSFYDKSIDQSERSPLKVICSEMTYDIFFTVCQALLERDRFLFVLLMALEIEDSHGNVNIGEREFLVSPEYGFALMNALGCPSSESRAQAKKPFDWMNEEQFRNLQTLATYHDWFHEVFDKMPRDGREAQWRQLCEGDSPESVSKCRLPDNADEHYTALQRLLVVRAVRSERLIHAATEFVYRVLGKKFLRDESPDLQTAASQASAKIPGFLLFTNENQSAFAEFTRFVAKSSNTYDIFNVSGCGENENRRARQCLDHAMETGSLLLLHNTQNNPKLLQTLYSHLTEAPSVHPSFQLWVTCEADSKYLSTVLLHGSVKVMIDMPKGIKDNLLRFFSTHVDSDVINASSRPEWLPCLHNVCLLHGAIRLRGRLPSSVGWQQPDAFLYINREQLQAAFAVVTKEFMDIQSSSDAGGNIMLRNISWPSMRSQIADFIYGCDVTNAHDQLALNSMVDYWLAASSVKKEFELPKVKYRLPSVLFAPSVRQSAILQSLDALPQHSLEVPEACNLHPASDAIVGEDQYIFTRLNMVYDFLPETQSLSHKLYPRPPTALDVPPQTSISSTSSHPWVVERGVFATHSHFLLKSKKEIELWEVCYNALPKLPKSWSREYVNDRIRKLGGPTPFNLFIQRELVKLHKLLAEIRRSLLAIKAAVENLDLFGDRLTHLDVVTASELIRSRIPSQWMSLAGETAPPNSTPLSQWLSDLSTRVAHFERILVLGKDKIPAFWLGAFFKPHALISVLKQEAIKNHIEKTGNVDNVVFHTEVTQRDKDHLRDPPSEGFFLHGVYMWGCAWDKTSGEIMDVAPRYAQAPLPVIHVMFTTETAKYGTGSESARPVDIYPCPVFITRTSPKVPVFELDVARDSVPSSRWALRGLTATIRNY